MCYRLYKVCAECHYKQPTSCSACDDMESKTILVDINRPENDGVHLFPCLTLEDVLVEDEYYCERCLHKKPPADETRARNGN